MCSSTHLNRDGLCQPAYGHTCLQSTGQALTVCPKFYEEAGFSAWGEYSCAAGALAGVEEAAGLCAEHALLLHFTVKLLLRDTLMKYKCETCFKWAEPRDEQQL